MEKERIDQYFADSAVRARLIGAVSRLVAVKSVKGEPTPDAPFRPRPQSRPGGGLEALRRAGLHRPKLR